MKPPPDKPAKLPETICRWAVACTAYLAMVGVSIAAAATLVSETIPLLVVGL